MSQDPHDGTVTNGSRQPNSYNQNLDPKLRESASSMGSTQQVFGQSGPPMRRAGFAVLPAKGKSPLRSGFTRWRHAPGLEVVQRWAAQAPTADIAYVPGLSRVKRGGDALIVVDGDDKEACDRVIELFGDTPGKVQTRRGKHFIYRDTGSSLGKIQSIKKFGINADIKHGHTIVVAPPSRHVNDSSFCYSWDGCDETVIRDLPPFNAHALQRLIESQSPGWISQPNVTSTARPPGGSSDALLHEGSRALGLNKYLCGQVGACDSFEALLDCAHTYNSNIVNKRVVALEPDEVLARTKAVWKDMHDGKLEHWHHQPAVARTDAKEVRDLCARSKNGGDATALLMLLRAEHQARTLRGETFALDVKAMADCKTLPWTIERFRKAIKVLVDANCVEVVTPSTNSRKGRRATQYTLVQRQIAKLARLG